MVSLWIINPLTVGAAAKTCTWKTTGTFFFNNVANWDTDCGGGLPANGDTLIFKDGSATKLTNDIAGLTSVNEIKFPTTNSSTNLTIEGALEVKNITLEKNRNVTFNSLIKLNSDGTITLGEKTKDEEFNATLSLVGGLNINDKNLTVTTSGDAKYGPETKYSQDMAYMQVINLTGGKDNKIKLSNISLNLGGDNSTTLESPIELNNTIFYTNSTNSLGKSTITSNNSLLILSASGSKATITNNIIFNGNLFGATNDTYVKSGLRGIIIEGEQDVDFKGTVEFKKDTYIGVETNDKNRTVTFSGEVKGPGAPFLDIYSSDYILEIKSDKNSSPVPNGKYITLEGAVTSSSIELKDDKTDDIVIPKSVTAIVLGKRGNVVLLEGSVLKGTGTVKNVYINTNATVLPGTSPGCLNTGNIEYAGASTLMVELDGDDACSKYDQINVTGTVKLGSSVTLDIARLSSYKPKLKTKFTIIKNDGDDAISGNFKGLEEGETIKKDDATYTISYKGGDGYDVELTVTKVPGTPDTGIMQITKFSNLIIVGTLVTIASVLLVGTRKNFSKSKR